MPITRRIYVSLPADPGKRRSSNLTQACHYVLQNLVRCE
jgi:hypothetical protein